MEHAIHKSVEQDGNKLSQEISESTIDEFDKDHHLSRALRTCDYMRQVPLIQDVGLYLLSLKNDLS